jgi:hypothetical protein
MWWYIFVQLPLQRVLFADLVLGVFEASRMDLYPVSGAI